MSFRAFLNYKGLCEVFDQHGLTQDKHDAVMKDLMVVDEPTPETGGLTIVAGYHRDIA